MTDAQSHKALHPLAPKKQDAGPPRQPGERNLLQFSTFVGVEECKTQNAGFKKVILDQSLRAKSLKALTSVDSNCIEPTDSDQTDEVARGVEDSYPCPRKTRSYAFPIKAPPFPTCKIPREELKNAYLLNPSPKMKGLHNQQVYRMTDISPVSTVDSNCSFKAETKLQHSPEVGIPLPPRRASLLHSFRLGGNSDQENMLSENAARDSTKKRSWLARTTGSSKFKSDYRHGEGKVAARKKSSKFSEGNLPPRRKSCTFEEEIAAPRRKSSILGVMKGTVAQATKDSLRSERKNSLLGCTKQILAERAKKSDPIDGEESHGRASASAMVSPRGSRQKKYISGALETPESNIIQPSRIEFPDCEKLQILQTDLQTGREGSELSPNLLARRAAELQKHLDDLF